MNSLSCRRPSRGAARRLPFGVCLAVLLLAGCSQLEVRIEPFVRVNRRKVEVEARKLADFYGAPVDVAWR